MLCLMVMLMTKKYPAYQSKFRGDRDIDTVSALTSNVSFTGQACTQEGICMLTSRAEFFIKVIIETSTTEQAGWPGRYSIGCPQ